MDARGIDNDPGWVNRELQKLRREVEGLRSERRAAATTVGESGSWVIKGLLRVIGALDLTGTLSMKSEDDVEMVRIGDMPYGRGFELKRDDGTSALRFRKAFSNSTTQSWELTDRDGYVVLAENGLGPGLSRPHLLHSFQPVAATSGSTLTCGPYGFERTTSSPTWETLFMHDGKAQNRQVDLKFAALCSDGATAGQIQVIDLDTGLPVPGFLMPAWLGAIPAGTTTYTVIDPTPLQVVVPMSGGAGSYVRLGVQARRTAGTGSITLAVPQSIGG